MTRNPTVFAVFTGLLTLAASVLTATRADAEPRSTMYVSGRFLHDRQGERVILRGVNAMIVYWDRTGEVTYPEVTKTGANCCRIFWTVKADATPKQLDTTLANCRRQKMIPIPCVWDATGKWEKLDECVDFWCRPEIAAVLRKHEDLLLVNIANEAGKGDVSHQEYRAAYAKGVNSMREAGLHMPLVIDAANWGRGEDYLLKNAAYLVEQDPDHNLIFSWHPWDTDQLQSRYTNTIDRSIEQGFCLIIGEFSRVGVFFKKPIDWRFLVEYCQKREIGWLPWVWWCCGKQHDGHSITQDKIFGHWANDPWGEQIAVGSPFSIQNTARRPKSLDEAVHEE